jgi:uncharacterized protein (DUF1330 family)
MTVFVVGQITIHDRAAYEKYDAGFMDIFDQFEGSLLSVDEAPIIVEGACDATRSVLIQFPDEPAFRKWFESPAYKALCEHRWAGATSNIYLVNALA